MPQGGNCRISFLARIYQVFGQGTDNAITSGNHIGDPVPVLACCFYYPACGGIDNSGNTT